MIKSPESNGMIKIGGRVHKRLISDGLLLPITSKKVLSPKSVTRRAPLPKSVTVREVKYYNFYNNDRFNKNFSI
jgi:hypothetical protein